MKTKTTITASDRVALQRHIIRFRSALIAQNQEAGEVAEILGCHVDDAVDLCNGNERVDLMIDRIGMEIAPDDEPHIVPFPAVGSDRLELLAVGAAAMGFVGVILWAAKALGWVV